MTEEQKRKELTAEQRAQLLDVLKARFEKICTVIPALMGTGAGEIGGSPAKALVVVRMERTGGERMW